MGIHLRLANADEMLEPIKDAPDMEMDDGSPKIDLLVQRLNDSIQSAIQESEKWNNDNTTEQQQGSSLIATCIVVNEEIDRQAKDIEYQQSQVEDGWIEDHSLIDEDGRARCAFHFCRKLFKDSAFLKKHIIKKHSEFLRAEMAKCHDSYMMSAWDSQEQRPVPPILVDCGHRFGVKPSTVLGAAEPLAEDRGHIRNNNQIDFVDVDDMKVEKVEIAFDTIEIPVQSLKKKKKKKKLL